MKKDSRDRIEQVIAEGKLGVARDRLYDVVRSNPNDWEARTLLGEVNYRLGYEVEAGRFWFLDESITEEKQTAIDSFVKSCNGQPNVILRRLRIQFDPASMPRIEAEKRIRDLVDDCDRRGVTAPVMCPGTRRLPNEVTRKDIGLLLLSWSCGLAAATIGFLALIGLFSLLDCGPRS